MLLVCFLLGQLLLFLCTVGKERESIADHKPTSVGTWGEAERIRDKQMEADFR